MVRILLIEDDSTIAAGLAYLWNRRGGVSLARALWRKGETP